MTAVQPMEAMARDTTFASQRMAMEIWVEQGLPSVLAHLGLAVPQILSSPYAQRCAVCGDDRIWVPDGFVGSVRVAGAGILLGKEQAQQVWWEQGAEEVFVHLGCGAGRRYAEQSAYEFNQAMADVVTHQVIGDWAAQVGLGCHQLSKTAMRGPSNFHPARGIIVDATGRLNLRQNYRLPHMFVVSASLPTEVIMRDIELYWQIASGPDGLGNRFTSSRPFVINVIGSREQEKLLLDRLESLHQFTRQQGGRVVARMDIVRY